MSSETYTHQKKKPSCEAAETSKATEKNSGNKESSTPNDDQNSVSRLVNLVQILIQNVESMETNIVTKVDAAIDAKIGNKIDMLEKDVRQLQEHLERGATKEDATSNDHVDVDVTSKSPSWIVIKATSQDDLPSSRVVKNVNKATDQVKKNGEKQQLKKIAVKKNGDKKQDAKIAVKKKNGVEQPHKKIGDKGAMAQSFSTESDCDIREKKQKLDNLFGALGQGLGRLNGNAAGPPIQGSSNIKRIVRNVTPSATSYDPFAKVEESKVRKLMDFIDLKEYVIFSSFLHYIIILDTNNIINDLANVFRGQPLRVSNSSFEFYNVIITLRKDWPELTYGWVGGSQVNSVMHMFHIRSLSDPCPYRSTRIAFLDQWFVSAWRDDRGDKRTHVL
ncbi:unnamed protein product [Thlaspi arvense]|uniref:Uncharacterized protein n=1 Tax=Thlaspi arvense TaxID=13288 RepID=A0AAU9SAQ9_THLAR|nr:unnamed protein product [Thlaspi arvense]